jgi:hypothetical protein
MVAAAPTDWLVHDATMVIRLRWWLAGFVEQIVASVARSALRRFRTCAGRSSRELGKPSSMNSSANCDVCVSRRPKRVKLRADRAAFLLALGRHARMQREPSPSHPSGR